MTHQPDITMVPLQVRARLACGIASAAPWGVALDGLLAAQLWADRKHGQRHAGQPTAGLLDVDQPEDLPLPLAACTSAPGQWHWSATCAFPEGRPALPHDFPVDVRYWTGRVDHRHLEQLTPNLPAVVSDRQGRYRARRMPLLVTPCAAVTWYAFGDPRAIADLLGTLSAIGKHRGNGEGHVIEWQVTERPDLDPWTAGHLHPDGSLGRPTPAACLTGRQVSDGGLGTAGLRPPYMHRARQHTLRLPALLDG